MADAPNEQDIREINARMAERILSEDPQPSVSGSYALRVLHTCGRTTGVVRRTPLGVTKVGDDRYLVAPDLRRDWVRNLTARPECVLEAGDERAEFRAVRVGGADAVSAVVTYLSAVQVPWALEAFPVSPGAARSEIAAHLGEMAVFRLEAGEGPAGGGS